MITNEDLNVSLKQIIDSLLCVSSYPSKRNNINGLIKSSQLLQGIVVINFQSQFLNTSQFYFRGKLFIYLITISHDIEEQLFNKTCLDEFQNEGDFCNIQIFIT